MLKVFRYVDDYLFLLRTHSFQQHVNKVFKMFEDNSQGLVFTSEVPQEGVVTFVAQNGAPKTASPFYSTLVASVAAWAPAPRGPH